MATATKPSTETFVNPSTEKPTKPWAKRFKKTLNVPVIEPDPATRALMARDFSQEDAFIAPLTPAVGSFFWHQLNTRNRGIKFGAETSYEGDLMHETVDGTSYWIGPTTDAIGIAFARGNEVDAEGNLDDTPGISIGAKGRLVLDASGNPVIATAGPRAVGINGQHRCAAHARTGKTSRATFVIGVPLAARDVVDGGVARRTKDQMEIGGLSNASRTDSCVRALDYLMTQERKKFSVPEIKTYIREWAAELDWTSQHVPTNRLYGTPEVAAAFMFAFRAVKGNPELLAKLTKTAENLREGVELEGDSPIRMFREYCTARPTTHSKKRQTGFSFSFRALNALAKELQDEIMATPRRGMFPDNDEGYNYFDQMI